MVWTKITTGRERGQLTDDSGRWRIIPRFRMLRGTWEREGFNLWDNNILTYSQALWFTSHRPLRAVRKRGDVRHLQWWARRFGGGAPVGPITILGVHVDTGDQTITTWDFSSAVSAADFTAGTFHNNSIAEDGLGVSQVDATTLEVVFQDSSNDGDTWIYDGAVTNVTTPQTGSMIYGP